MVDGGGIRQIDETEQQEYERKLELKKDEIARR